MPCAIFLPIFGELAEPRLVADLAGEAEAAGWDGVFVWDHMLYRAPVTDIADPWITLAAVAMATERVRIGPMVTPLPRRRPKLARETLSLDRLSAGRLVLGVGMGGDPGGELTAFGEELDPERARCSTKRSRCWSTCGAVSRCCAAATATWPRTPACGRRRPAAPHPDLGRRPLRQPPPAAPGGPLRGPVPGAGRRSRTARRDGRGRPGAPPHPRPYDVMIARPASEGDPSAWFDAGATWWAAGRSFTVEPACVRAIQVGPGLTKPVSA